MSEASRRTTWSTFKIGKGGAKSKGEVNKVSDLKPTVSFLHWQGTGETEL